MSDNFLDDVGGFVSGASSEEDWHKNRRQNPVSNVDQDSYLLNAGKYQNMQDQATKPGAGYQNSVAQSYLGAMNGNAPSVAQAQLGAGQDAAMRQLQSAQASQHSANVGLGNRNLLNAQADILGHQNQQQALLRAQETDAARKGLGTLSTNMRQQGGDESRSKFGMQATSQQMAQQYDQQKRMQEQRAQDQNWQRIQSNDQARGSLVRAGVGALGTAAAGFASGGSSLLGPAIAGVAQGASSNIGGGDPYAGGQNYDMSWKR